MAKFREIQNPHKIVDAVQLTEATIYICGNDEIKANPGDWQVTRISEDHATTHVGLITAENFEKTYEPLGIDDEISHITGKEISAFHEAEATAKAEVEEFINECKYNAAQGNSLVGQKL